MRESIIQKQIIEALELSGWYVVKVIQTNKNGWPDLNAYRNKEAVFIEVKAEYNKATPLQMYRMQELNKQGFQTIIAYSKKDIQHLCK